MNTNNFILANLDTDAVAFCKADGSYISKEERIQLLNELNSNYPETIKFTDDGYYSRMLILKTKNYCTVDENGKLKIRGSALRSSKTEPGFKQCISEVIDILLADKKDELPEFYKSYVKKMFNIQDMTPWCKKVTVTESVLSPERTNEQKVLDAIGKKQVQMGDKLHLFFTEDGSLCLRENWQNNHSPMVLVEKLYKTLAIFKNVIDMTQFKKYHLKNHDIRCELHELLGIDPPVKVKKSKKPAAEEDSHV